MRAIDFPLIIGFTFLWWFASLEVDKRSKSRLETVIVDVGEVIEQIYVQHNGLRYRIRNRWRF